MTEHRRHRPVLLVLLLAVALPLAWAGWHTWQGARDLQEAERQLRALEGELDVEGGASRLAEVGRTTQRARGHLSDPVVRALAELPVAGEPLAAAGHLADAVDIAVREALLPLADAAGPAPAEQLTAGPGSVDLDYVSALVRPATDAAGTLQRAQRVLAGAPTDTYSDTVDAAVGDLRSQLAELQATVDDVTVALGVAPELLGQDGPRRYLVVSQSPAEARGTGGLIGGYSLLQATDGVIEIVRSGSKAELQSSTAPVVDLGPEFDDHYGINGAAAGWINSNLSPHFPYAAQIWLELWERQFGEQLDGALVLDPVALSYLLGATGPVPLPDGSTVSESNVVDLTMRDVYARFSDDPRRDALLQAVSNAVAVAVTTRELPGRALVTAGRRAVSERRLLLYSAHEDVQTRLAGQPISGTLPESPAVGDVVVDAAGSKLDYYLERDLRYTPGCDAGPSRLALRLTNAAPASGLPEYVTPTALRNGEPPGTNALLVTLYLPGGALVEELTVDGQGTFHRQGAERGLTWVEALVSLRPGASKDVVATFRRPGDPATEPARVAQPLVRPETFSVDRC